MSSPWTSWPPPTFPTSSQVKNLSGVLGPTVTDALNTLGGVIGALTTSSIANVSGVAGATATAALNTLAAAIAALTTTSIANVSGVAGATATAALNTLAAAIAALTSTNIANASTVTGATVTAALNTLATIAAARRDAIWDPPTTPSADDQEFTTDVLALGTGGWTLVDVGALTTPLTRDGAIDLSQTPAANHYRSSCIGGVLYIQVPANKTYVLSRQLAAALTGQQLWFMGGGLYHEIGSVNDADPAFSLQITKGSGGGIDLANRVLISARSSVDRQLISGFKAGVNTQVATNTVSFLTAFDGLALRVNHSAADDAGGFGFRRNGSYGTVCALTSNVPLLNSATDRMSVNMCSNFASPVGPGVSALFALRFIRRVSLGSGAWIAQP